MNAANARTRIVARCAALAVAGLLAAMSPTAATASAVPEVEVLIPPNPITLENRHPGDPTWRIPWAGKVVADDRTMAIKGYASATSVRAGESIGLHVKAGGPFTYHVYRIGDYQGLGGRLMAVGSGPATAQPACPTADTGMISCPWSRTVTVATTQSWTSGVYVVVLTTAGYQNYVTFVVRDDRPGVVLAVSPTNTYQAYNNFPDDGLTGKSLYAYNSYGATTVNGTVFAVTVSYDRPYARTGVTDVLRDELPFIQWAEARGYDLTYATDVDLHSHPRLASDARAVWVPGHSEYWTDTMYEAIESARDAGVSGAFLGANDLFWRVRLEPDAAGRPDRRMTCWKDVPEGDPVQDPELRTDLFRRLGKSEQLILGEMYSAPQGLTQGRHPWVVTAANSWFYRGTGMTNGTSINGIVGGETDFRHAGDPFPASLQSFVLSRSPTVDRYGGAGLGESVLYRAPSDAWVFDAGSLRYTWGLGTVGTVDPRAQVMTTNLMARQAGFASTTSAERIGGSDRYETAAMVSARTFDPGVPTVWLTTGLDFPDALSASAATRGESPVLLVRPDAIPAAVAAELARLHPGAVRVLGRPATISDAVLREAQRITGAQVARIAGDDRFATSALVSRDTFAPGVPVLFVSTGLKFPDALAAGAAGAQAGGPVLLTRPDGLSAAVRAEIERLAPSRIIVTGATDAVAESVFTQLQGIAPTIRLAGSDRYETARMVSRDLGSAGTSTVVALTTGQNFPDGLAGAAMVANRGGTIVLVRSTLDPASAEEIVRSDPGRLVFLGTDPTVSTAVEKAARRLFDVVDGVPTPVITDPVPPMLPASAVLNRTTQEPLLDSEYDRVGQALDELPWLSTGG
ncbi:MAG: cell wall-binding repeat-containing protein [Dermatophilaceae bacterium]